MRFWAVCLVCLAAWAGALAGCGTRDRETAPSGAAEGSFPSQTDRPMLLERRELVLEWPQSVRVNDQEWVSMTVRVAEKTPKGDSAAGAVDLYQTHNVVAAARLELAGAEVETPQMNEPLLPGRAITFRWRIRATTPGTYRGTLWLHMQLVPKDGGPVDEVLVLARKIEIEATTVLGMPANAARAAGAAGIITSLLLGLTGKRSLKKKEVRQTSDTYHEQT